MNDQTGPVKPTVIDLDPDQVVDEAGTSAPDERPGVSAVRSMSGRKLAVVLTAALLLGALLGAWLYRDVLARYLPSDTVAALDTRLAAVEKNAAELSVLLKQPSSADQKLASDVTALETKLMEQSTQQQSVSQLRDEDAAKIAALSAAQQKLAADVTVLLNRPSVISNGSGSALPPDLLARIDTLEKDLTALKAGITAKPDTSALSQALSDLKAKIELGVAYKSEFDRISQFVPAAAGLDVLALHAEIGLPDARRLATELAVLTPSLPTAETAPVADTDKSWLDSISESLGSVITIRESGTADWQALAKQAHGFADAGDLPQAMAAIDSAEGAKPAALQGWRDRAAQRLNVELALSQTVQSVMREISARQ